jgi:hypothetical protein
MPETAYGYVRPALLLFDGLEVVVFYRSNVVLPLNVSDDGPGGSLPTYNATCQKSSTPHNQDMIVRDWRLATGG